MANNNVKDAVFGLAMRAVAEYLPQNVVACSLRFTSKSLAAHLRNFNRINLKEPFPARDFDAFASRLGSPASLRPFSRRHMVQLLSLVAASGNLSHLKLLLTTVFRYLTGDDSVSADDFGPEQWQALEQHSVHLSMYHLIDSAAAAGHALICRWLLDSGCEHAQLSSALAAARGGLAPLATEMSPALPEFDTGMFSARVQLLAAIAEGCDFETLRQTCDRLDFRGRRHVVRWEARQSLVQVLAAAAASPAADWQARLQWLEEQGPEFWLRERERVRGAPEVWRWCPEVCDRVAGSALEDAPARLTWLRAQGYPLGRDVVQKAAAGGNVAAIEYLLGTEDGEALGWWQGTEATEAAVRNNQLDALKLLHARGLPLDPHRALRVAVRSGHLAMVTWLAGAFGGEAAAGGDGVISSEELQGLCGEAVASGSLALLRWMHGRGCFRGRPGLLFEAVVTGQSEEMVDWLVAHGCGLKVNARMLPTYHNLPALRCLQRLGWRPTSQELEGVRAAAAGRSYNGPTLRFLDELEQAMTSSG